MARFSKMAIAVFVYMLILLSLFSGPVFADEPPILEISMLPGSDTAVAGQTFTYTIVITNVSQSPLKDVIVVAETPQGTTHRTANLIAGQKWLINGNIPGQPGQITWITQEVVPPGDGAVIEFVVDVLPEADSPLVNESYLATTLSDYGQADATGPPIETQVIVPTPSPTASPLPDATATGTTTPVRSNLAAPATATPIPIAQTDSEPVSPASIEDAPSAPASDIQTASPSESVVIIVGLAFAAILIGMIWYWRRSYRVSDN